MKKRNYVKTTRKVIIEKTVENIDNLFKLTMSSQTSKKCKDKKTRSYWLFFLNDVLILKQKMPYDTNYSFGYGHHTGMDNVYLLNSSIYQTRGCYAYAMNRQVKYPVSKEKLASLNVPKDLKIQLSDQVILEEEN